MPVRVHYIDFGFKSARDFWEQVMVPAYERFQAEPSPGNAIDASVHEWQVHEWIWHERHRGQDTKDNRTVYKQFKSDLFADCPELAWIRDVGEAGKHSGLGRSPPPDVLRVTTRTRFFGPLNTIPLNTMPLNTLRSETTPLVITLTDGSEHGFCGVLSRVNEYWRKKHFR